MFQPMSADPSTLTELSKQCSSYAMSSYGPRDRSQVFEPTLGWHPSLQCLKMTAPRGVFEVHGRLNFRVTFNNQMGPDWGERKHRE